MPRTLTQYIHRVGRTARAGSKGRACTFVGEGQRKLLKQIVKNTTREKVKSRVLATDTVAECREQIEKMERDVANVLEEEHQEKEMRKAEMEASKARNMLDHSEEIHSRPQRTWFQTTREKSEAKKRGLNAYMGEQQEGLSSGDDSKEDEGATNGSGLKGVKSKKSKSDKNAEAKLKRSPFDGMSRKKRRKMQQQMEAAKESGVSVGELRHSIKTAKTMDRLRRLGIGPGPEQKKKGVRKGQSRDGAGGGVAVGGAAGAGVFDKEMRGAEPLSKGRPKHRVKRGTNSFKSKKRYKRR
mmetsp:Transcript_26159/g.42871  ORF Transcript_26159/g.42871 Transcript_26159/m.42871 type:complete len:297 (-) Transcript_26159:103-993(-)